MKAVTKIREEKIRIDSSELELKEKLVSLDRVSKVVKGGRHLRFRALVVVGDGKGHVGFGLAKAGGVPDATQKASAMAKKNLIEAPVTNSTIPHEILAKYGASKVLLKPALPGTGLICSNTVRAVLELVGIRDILSKSLGSSNRINVVKATMVALTNLKKPKETATETKAVEDKVNETE
ncbi:MAG: 30S ribosomal protein S5 [Chloroflexi bacterium CG08_land_8_20_14_0_20_45_12]|nr:MAG: 30S ribosomal protein S5 [Chloroflexi bacterium CG08_land_8_20_14_0_20_45_12]